MSPIETPVDSVKLVLAGAPFEIRKEQILGSFWAIPVPLWHNIIGFHREISLRYEAESMSYHRWHAKSGSYHSFIPYQVTRAKGLSVTCNLQSPENIAILDAYGREHGEDFMQGACTIHTHVDVSAFESGTDAADEKSLPAWHITLGRLLSRAEYDLDFRMRIPHTPKVRALVDPDSAYKLDWRCLFAEGVNKKDVFACPGTQTWFDLCKRVSIA
jgi:hypothetical protein